MTVKELRSLVNGFLYVWVMTEEGELLSHAEMRELSTLYDDATVIRIGPDFSFEFADTHYSHFKILDGDKALDVVHGLNIYIAEGDKYMKA